MANRIERRQFLKAGVASTLALAMRPSLTFAAGQEQKFRIGMAATTWLSADPSIATYWKATEGIAALDIGPAKGNGRLGNTFTALLIDNPHRIMAAFVKR